MAGWGDALIPIARFTNGDWVNTWPAPEEATVAVPALADLPVAWLGGPAPRHWRLWQDGSSSIVEVSGARRGERDKHAGCLSPAVLELRSALRPPADDFWPVAVDTGEPIARPIPMESGDDGWAEIQAAVLQRFADAEAKTNGGSGNKSVDDKLAEAHLDLTQQSMTIEHVFRDPLSSSDSPVIFFAATKKAPDRDLGRRVSGWLRRDASGWTALTLSDDVITPESNPVSSPIAMIQHAGREFVLMSENAVESGGFAIFEITSSAVRRLVSAGNGGC